MIEKEIDMGMLLPEKYLLAANAQVDKAVALIEKLKENPVIEDHVKLGMIFVDKHLEVAEKLQGLAAQLLQDVSETSGWYGPELDEEKPAVKPKAKAKVKPKPKTKAKKTKRR